MSGDKTVQGKTKNGKTCALSRK